jgi:hypothetical protein
MLCYVDWCCRACEQSLQINLPHSYQQEELGTQNVRVWVSMDCPRGLADHVTSTGALDKMMCRLPERVHPCGRYGECSDSGCLVYFTDSQMIDSRPFSLARVRQTVSCPTRRHERVSYLTAREQRDRGRDVCRLRALRRSQPNAGRAEENLGGDLDVSGGKGGRTCILGRLQKQSRIVRPVV